MTFSTGLDSKGMASRGDRTDRRRTPVGLATPYMRRNGPGPVRAILFFFKIVLCPVESSPARPKKSVFLQIVAGHGVVEPGAGVAPGAIGRGEREIQALGGLGQG